MGLSQLGGRDLPAQVEAALAGGAGRPVSAIDFRVRKAGSLRVACLDDIEMNLEEL